MKLLTLWKKTTTSGGFIFFFRRRDASTIQCHVVDTSLLIPYLLIMTVWSKL